MSPTSYSRVLSSLTRLLALLKISLKYQSGQWLKRADGTSCSSFNQASTLMAEAIRKIPTQTGMTDSRVVPFGHSVFKELKLVQQ